MVMFTDYDTWMRRGKTQGTNNRKSFSLQKMEDKIDEVLTKYIPEFPKQVKLNLPKLEKVQKNKGLVLPKLNLPKLEKVENE